METPFSILVDISAFLLHVSSDHVVSFPIFAGILASILHVISGPDHLAAVTPLVIESEQRVWKIGLAWGFGHVSGMLLIGVLFLFFKEHIPLEKISEYSELSVGILLIGIGLWAFYSLFRTKTKHSHPHIHNENKPYIHDHSHQHDHDHESHTHFHNNKTRQNLLSSYGIGVLHGLAGIAHFILFLPVLSFTSQFDGIQYLVGFGIGTLIAMTAYTFVLGAISSYSKEDHNKLFFVGIRLAGGLFALVIGIYWIYIGV